jgi:integrase
MATIGTEKFKLDNGTTTTTYRVLFVDPTGRRQTIRFGKVPRRIAETAKLKIESLLAARIAGQPIDSTTAAWLDAIGDAIHAKLARAGLVEPREKIAAASWTLGEFLDRYFDTLGDQKRMTRVMYDRARRLLEEFFGKDRRIDSIGEEDAADYKAWLLKPTKTRKACSAASASVDLRRARQFFKVAVRRQAISRNPFEEVRCGSQSNPARKAFVTRETIEAVIEACPDAEWRLIFALARYAGLRIPSELEDLKWTDVNWSKNRFTVRVPKKAHIAGHEERVIPIFAELRPYFDEAFEAAAEKAGDYAVYVVPRARGNRNLRRYADQIVARAGVAKWPKLFNNCRASREIELMESHPAHVVFAWIGHTAAVARSHYLQTTDADFDRAAGTAGPAVYPAHYPAHSPAATSPLTKSRPQETREKTRVCRSGRGGQISPAGIEPATFSSGG